MLKFKKGDKIRVVLGKDKGQEGVIEKIFPKELKALVPNVNLYKKHVKGTEGKKGGIYEVARPLSFSKIALICPKCAKITRVGFRLIDGKKVRICKKCKREIDIKEDEK